MTALDLPDGWQVLPAPDGFGGRLTVLRTGSGPGARLEPLSDLLDGLTAGLAQTFTDVFAIDAGPAMDAGRAGAVRMLHTATDSSGGGVSVETLARPEPGAGIEGIEVLCWVAPTGRYPADRDTARRFMAGRPVIAAPGRPESAAPDPPESALPVPVTAADLTVARGPHPGTGGFLRRGPYAWAVLPGLPDPTPVPASVLPAWLLAGFGAGPRPVPATRPLVVTTRPALDRLIRLDHADPDAVRRALDAPGLDDGTAASLAGLVNGLTGHWWLDWTCGLDSTVEPVDDEWTSTVPVASGRLEILDAGAAGLWRVVTDLPDILAAELGTGGVGGTAGGEPVALARTTTADLWLDLTRLVAD